VVAKARESLSPSSQTHRKGNMVQELVLIPKLKYEAMIKRLNDEQDDVGRAEPDQTGGERVDDTEKVEVKAEEKPENTPVQPSEESMPHEESKPSVRMYVKRPLVDILPTRQKAKRSRWIDYRV
jgi:hypothetical protein